MKKPQKRKASHTDLTDWADTFRSVKILYWEQYLKPFLLLPLAFGLTRLSGFRFIRWYPFNPFNPRATPLTLN